MAASLTLEPAARSDFGRRTSNEDALFAGPRMVAVADGVGGAAAGEVASRAAIDALVHLDKCRLPDLQVDEAVRGVHEVRPTPERRDECGRLVGGHAQTGHRDVHPRGIYRGAARRYSLAL